MVKSVQNIKVNTAYNMLKGTKNFNVNKSFKSQRKAEMFCLSATVMSFLMTLYSFFTKGNHTISLAASTASLNCLTALMSSKTRPLQDAYKEIIARKNSIYK